MTAMVSVGGAASRTNLYRVVPHHCQQKPHKTAPLASLVYRSRRGFGLFVGQDGSSRQSWRHGDAQGSAMLTMTRTHFQVLAETLKYQPKEWDLRIFSILANLEGKTMK